MPIKYEFTKSKKDGHSFVMITGFEGKVSNLVVPDIIEETPVEAIGNHAFSGAMAATRLVFNPTVIPGLTKERPSIFERAPSKAS